MAAWATVAAVVVAILGAVGAPVWVDWYRRLRHGPKLDLTAKESTYALTSDERHREPIALELRNDEDRYAAENVEVFISGTAQPTTGVSRLRSFFAEQAPIPLGEAAVTSVPPNFSRIFALAWLRTDLDAGQLRPRDVVGYLATPEVLPPRELRFGLDYWIEVAVTGSNFNASFWGGKLSIRRGEDVGGEPRCEASWVQPLKRTH